MDHVWLWVGFNLFVLAMLALDLGVFHRKAHKVSLKESLGWTCVWVVLALVFNAGVWHFLGSQKALEFFTGYIIEKSLSVDNLFVFLVVFGYFGIHPMYQPRVLRWGILGAILMRASLIVIGVELVHAFKWMLYVFGTILIITAFRLIKGIEEEVDPSKNVALKFVSRHLPVSTELHGEKFLVRIKGVLYATPLLATLIVIESTDQVFALDSIPAVLGISQDLFIVYTSNIFAILGLRALYFALAGVMQLFHYLKYALAIILGFIGVKLLIHDFLKIPIGIALGVVFGLLVFAILGSLIFPKKRPRY